MPIVAIVPVKSFRVGKGRMADSLDPQARRRLGEAFADRTISVAESAGLIPLLVAGGTDVAEWGLARGIPSIADTGGGLSGAAAEGVAWAGVSGSGWMVLHADLPLLREEDLTDPARLIEDGQLVLAPSADGGTSLFGGTGPARFRYGPASFHHHLGAHPDARVVVRLGLLFDADSYRDLESARAHRYGAWLTTVDW